ncbi:MAG: hypothetical protein HY243_15230 [Proteobacteria bacterium]|nr:hypothetical protein [Pseudomonadota bacterium]
MRQDESSATTGQLESAKRETVTPVLERSITELVTLFGQIFTTPFAFLTFNQQFRRQISALAANDLEAAEPDSIARPLTFFVSLMGVHFLLSGLYWRMAFPHSTLKQALSSDASALVASGAQQPLRYYNSLATIVGSAEAALLIAFGITLIVAAKSLLVSLTGQLLRCPIRFLTGLHASAYALGTFIFIQYVFILVRYLLAQEFGDVAFRYGFTIIIYGSLILGMVLVVRVVQTIRMADGTPELPTYLSWFIGTVIWQFVVTVGAIHIAPISGYDGFWANYAQYWRVFAQLMDPTNWHD